MNFDKIKNLEGWGEISARNLSISIENSKKLTLQKFIYSLGIRHIGIENAKLISDNVKSITKFTDTINKNEFEKFANIDGIGETQINSLKNFFSNQINKNIFLELQDILEIQNQKNIKNGALSNNTFMFTGKLDGISRAEAKSLIEKKSGITVSTISKNLNYLVIGEKPTKRKVENAKNLGIKILSKEDFVKLLD